jgi:hypothetical protein
MVDAPYVKARPNRLSGVAIGQILDELQDRHQCEPPGMFGWMPVRGGAVGEVVSALHRAERVPNTHAQCAVRESSTRDMDCFLWNRLWRLGYGNAATSEASLSEQNNAGFHFIPSSSILLSRR